MPYRHIGALIHNWSHSFLSLMNYVDDGYAIDDLAEFLKRGSTQEVVIDPLSRALQPATARTPRLMKSLDYWADSLPQLMENHNVLPRELVSFTLRVTRVGGGLRGTAHAVDDRGKEYAKPVVPP
jgi:hypothetical protein